MKFPSVILRLRTSTVVPLTRFACSTPLAVLFLSVVNYYKMKAKYLNFGTSPSVQISVFR